MADDAEREALELEARQLWLKIIYRLGFEEATRIFRQFRAELTIDERRVMHDELLLGFYDAEKARRGAAGRAVRMMGALNEVLPKNMRLGPRGEPQSEATQERYLRRLLKKGKRTLAGEE